MPQPFSQLMRQPTKEQLLASLIAMLKGIGLTTHTGFSPGGVTITGVPAENGTLLVRIVASGNLNAGTYQYSVDGGATWSGTAAIPANGLVVLSFTELTLTFTDAPVGQTGFLAGDVFSIDFAVPTWPLTAWQPGSAGLSYLEFDATVLEDVYALLHDVASSGFLTTALGDWLDLWAANMYSTARIPGTVTEGQELFSDPTGVGPFNLTSGDVVLQSDEGLRFILSEDITVPLSGSVSGLIRAESKGAKYNVGNDTITQLVTSEPGLAVDNPAFAMGTWITTGGGDDETSDALVQRCIAKWATLAVGLPNVMYETWAKAADPAVNRAFARVSPTVAGQVDLFVAGAAGAVSGGVVANVQAYVNQRTALTNTVVVASVTNHAQTITGNVYIAQSFLTTGTAAVLLALETLLNQTKGIGATLYFSEIESSIQRPNGQSVGVRNTDITVPAATVVLAANEIFVFTNNLTFIGV